MHLLRHTQHDQQGRASVQETGSVACLQPGTEHGGVPQLLQLMLLSTKAASPISEHASRLWNRAHRAPRRWPLEDTRGAAAPKPAVKPASEPVNGCPLNLCTTQQQVRQVLRDGSVRRWIRRADDQLASSLCCHALSMLARRLVPGTMRTRLTLASFQNREACGQQLQILLCGSKTCHGVRTACQPACWAR